MTPRILLAIPVYNEERSVDRVLSEVRRYVPEILVIDDGSTDSTPALLWRHPVEVIRHARNRGYGRSIADMLRWARVDGHDWLVTMDCDEQHEPASIPSFLEAIAAAESGAAPADLISGSRYLVPSALDDAPPPDRRSINATITEELNRRIGSLLMADGTAMTDAFCGFKAFRVATCGRLRLDVDGYDFPMQFWVQAAARRLIVRELPVRLIYNDPTRTFGGPLDDAGNRLATYRRTLARELRRCADRLPASAFASLDQGPCGPDDAGIAAGAGMNRP
ncbi:MAG TPA: glycosyltransferase family 2 protein [Phycisphaerales bacterium]|nr:glycosyltransferase family 2 protein [Phycisphaerales bacterium]HMP36447.1 glycosyltransferase family 2 protein [Phycisphaerales bacterium]